MHYLLTTLVAITAVASFEAVGNILVVAMLIVPAAAAYLCTDRLGLMIAISVVIAMLAAVLGHVGAILVPQLIGFHSTNTAGMMATMTGVLFMLAALLAPRYGVLVSMARRGMAFATDPRRGRHRLALSLGRTHARGHLSSAAGDSQSSSRQAVVHANGTRLAAAARRPGARCRRLRIVRARSATGEDAGPLASPVGTVSRDGRRRR